MRKDIYHYFESSPEHVYDAYQSALSGDPFKKNAKQTPKTQISFRLTPSFTYNMNGGSARIDFVAKGKGTAVRAHYFVWQLLGARIGAYDDLLTETVEKNLHVQASPLDPSTVEF